MNTILETDVIEMPRDQHQVIHYKPITHKTETKAHSYILMVLVLGACVATMVATWVAVELNQAMRDMAQRSYQETLCYDFQGKLVTDSKTQFAVCEKVTIIRHKRDTLVLD